jgi:F420-dependent oxidoreductase-like protein
MTEPQQGATYDDLLRVARTAEDLGFDAFFRSDHLLRIGGGDPGPGSTDAWVTLGALARETTRIRLGTMVTSATFRLPGPLAIAVAQVDAMSGGRVELGLGTGWYEREHEAYGIPFPPVAERFERLTEQLEIVTGLWTSRTPFSFAGAHYTLVEAPALPKPVQSPHPPVVIGGKGPRRTPALAARFADEFNMPFASVEETAAQFRRVRAAGGERLVLSAAQTVAVGRDQAEVRRRLDAIGETRESLAGAGIVGTVTEAVEHIGRYAEAGASRLYCQLLDLSDLDHLELLTAEVARQV